MSETAPAGPSARLTADLDKEMAVERGVTAPADSADVAEKGQAAADEAPADTSEDEESKLPFSKARCIALVVTVTGASFLNILCNQSVVIILPTIGSDLGIPDSRLQWVVSSYSLTFGCFLLPWGRIADIYGKRTIFILGSAFAAVTIIANPFLQNEIAFSLFRGLSGIGGAANVPTAIGILGVTFPPGKAKNYAFAAYAAGAPLGSVFGNILAGVIASYASWKWVFGALGGLAILITVAGVVFIPPPPKQLAANRGQSLATSVDWIGAALIVGGLLALLFALTEGNIVGWQTVWIWLLIVIALMLIAIFVAWQWYQEKHTSRAPLMKVSIFNNRVFSIATIVMGIYFGAFNTFLVYATYFWQDYQDLGTLQTTLRFLPTGVTGMLVAFVMSHVISRVRGNVLMAVACALAAVSCLLFAVPIPPDTSYFAFGFPAMILSVVGTDIAWPCLTLFTSKTLPKGDQAMGGALINAAGQLGRAVILTVTTAIQVAVMARERGVSVEDVGPVKAWDPPSLTALRAANYFSFALLALCVPVCAISFRSMGIIGHVAKKNKKSG